MRELILIVLLAGFFGVVSRLDTLISILEAAN